MTPAVAAPAVSDLETLFNGFADPTRLRILNLLAAGELCVCDLVELLELPSRSYRDTSRTCGARSSWK